MATTVAPIRPALFDASLMLDGLRIALAPHNLLRGIKLCHTNPALRDGKTFMPWQDDTRYVEHGTTLHNGLPAVIPSWLWMDTRLQVIWTIHFTDASGERLVLPTEPQPSAPLLQAVYLYDHFVPLLNPPSDEAVASFTDVLCGWRRSTMRRQEATTDRPPGPSIIKTLRDALDGFFVPLPPEANEKSE
ncbi:MAG TPA: hypothetical protein VLG40_02695 [Candidatus Saccharimonas sp.]|nr:hypothetical protein [Candidatus Saccharimonas sp.]